MHQANINFSVFLCVLVYFGGFVESFDYKDEMAQGTCSSILPDSKPDHIYAVRRTCTSGSGQTCEAVCANLKKKCYNALHIYNGIVLGSSETGKEGLHAYRYNTCSGTGCGPNFCCCSDKEHPLPSPNAYKDEIAQAACTGMLQGPARHVYAVRRHCAGDTDCEAVCSNISKTCFNALHVYSSVLLGSTETGKEGLHTYRYNTCKRAGCGPNFCCCAGK